MPLVRILAMATAMSDAIIVQRYIELDSGLKRVMAVVKVRDSARSKEILQYEINQGGIAIGEPLLGYDGLLGGRPTRAPVAGKLNGDKPR